MIPNVPNASEIEHPHRQKEFNNAEHDCDAALRVDRKHLKALARRATARAALGKHRAATADLARARALQPANRALATQQAAVLDALLSAARNAPFKPLRSRGKQ